MVLMAMFGLLLLLLGSNNPHGWQFLCTLNWRSAAFPTLHLHLKHFHSTLIGETKDFPQKFNIVKNLNLSSFLVFSFLFIINVSYDFINMLLKTCH